MAGLALALTHAVLLAGAAEPAYEEQVVTPHWAWVNRHAAGPVKALFLLNERAVREADEVARRCDFHVTVLASAAATRTAPTTCLSGSNAWSNRAAEILHRHDRDARVGFCGVWEGFDRDPPSFFAACDFSEPYSPFHLYTPNLWLGNEHNLYRSFRRPGSIVTC